MALTGGGFGTGDFQAQLQTSPLTPDRAKYSTTRHRLGGQACPKRTRTEEQGRELPGAAATRGPCTPAAELGARSDGIPRSHLIWRYCLFSPKFPEVFRLSPNDLVFCGEAAQPGAGWLPVPAPSTAGDSLQVPARTCTDPSHNTTGTTANPVAGAFQQHSGCKSRLRNFIQ